MGGLRRQSCVLYWAGGILGCVYMSLFGLQENKQVIMCTTVLPNKLVEVNPWLFSSYWCLLAFPLSVTMWASCCNWFCLDGSPEEMQAPQGARAQAYSNPGYSSFPSPTASEQSCKACGLHFDSSSRKVSCESFPRCHWLKGMVSLQYALCLPLTTKGSMKRNGCALEASDLRIPYGKGHLVFASVSCCHSFAISRHC